MRVETKRCTTVRLYLPNESNKVQCLAPLMADAGGGTKWQANGGWINADGTTVSEAVEVFEFILTNLKHSLVLAWVESLGKLFLQDNPEEECFLAYVSGHAVKINRN